jgi:hypothetical protein
MLKVRLMSLQVDKGSLQILLTGGTVKGKKACLEWEKVSEINFSAGGYVPPTAMPVRNLMRTAEG